MRKIVAFWLLSLAAIAVLASGITAQAIRSAPKIVSGNDIGFRVEGTDPLSGKPVGTIVIRVDGEWKEVTGGMKATPAHTRR